MKRRTKKRVQLFLNSLIPSLHTQARVTLPINKSLRFPHRQPAGIKTDVTFRRYFFFVFFFNRCHPILHTGPSRVYYTIQVSHLLVVIHVAMGCCREDKVVGLYFTEQQ